MDQSLITGIGVGVQNEREGAGASPVSPRHKGGGVEKVIAMLKGHEGASFEAVLAWDTPGGGGVYLPQVLVVIVKRTAKAVAVTSSRAVTSLYP